MAFSLVSRDALRGAAVGGTAAAAALLMMLQRYVQNELQTPKLVHRDAEDMTLEDKYLLQEVRLLLREYWPHPILEFSGYTSTSFSGMLAMLPSKVYPGPVEMLTMADGGTVSLHWAEPPEPKNTVDGPKRIVILFPGLNNCSKTGFMQACMQHLRGNGFHCATMNYRGVGGLPLSSKKLAGFDSWQDFDPVVDHVVKTHPGAMLFAMGFSMGGCNMLRYLAEQGDKCRFKAAVGVAAVADLEAASSTLESTWRKKIMNIVMASGVKLLALPKLRDSHVREHADIPGLLLGLTLRDLDAAGTIRCNGYKTPDEYYSTNNPRPLLHRIAIPTLIINAADDPVVSIRDMPIKDIKKNPRMYLTITRRGGHIGWGSGGLGAAAWTDNMAADFMLACALRQSRL